jgi:hypothetical protein
LTPNPIIKVLSTLRKSDVRFLLMGGQACVLYGAAEFSRDMDIHLLASGKNFSRLRDALRELDAEVIAVPPFEEEYLARGHAVHFRCRSPEAENMRLDVMSRMRGVDSFEEVWERRTVAIMEDGIEVALLSLPDLVLAKKTQRDKDWPMIRRLVEANYEVFIDEPNPARVRFWLEETRTPELLLEMVARFPEEAAEVASRRRAVAEALTGDRKAVEGAMGEEMEKEREADRAYWAPLRQELEQLRRARFRGR